MVSIPWGKSRFTVVHMENNVINKNNTRINSCTYNCKPTFAPSCILSNIDKNSRAKRKKRKKKEKKRKIKEKKKYRNYLTIRISLWNLTLNE